MKLQIRKLLPQLAAPLAVGGLAALLTKDSMDLFGELIKPPLTPPAWVFPVVWTVLYLMMGFAAYFAVISPQTPARALPLYAAQLFFNFCWSLLFFNFRAFLFSFVWLVILWVLILFTLLAFRRGSKTAGRLLVPYLVWVTLAGYLNLAIFILNR
ncbi:MAG: tryptophan-rich sensory protein [Clostridia bacterium]|nr:tryptophan-rich sensory protein [Clostridia bacterium]MBR0538409.1 tryptophan-rich sensory protein [Clostridia bacterium]